MYNNAHRLTGKQMQKIKKRMSPKLFGQMQMHKGKKYRQKRKK